MKKKKAKKKTTKRKGTKAKPQKPKPKKEKKSTRRPLQLKGSITQRLQQVADWNAVSVEFAAVCKEILKQAKLTKKHLTAKVIREAGRIDRLKTEELQRKTWNLNGTWNRERSPEQEVENKKEQQEAKIKKEHT